MWLNHIVRMNNIRRCGRGRALLLALVLSAAASAATGGVPIETPGRVAVLERAFAPHWVWVADASGPRLALVDLDEGKLLGQISTGWGMPDLAIARTRPELYVPETYFSRGTRGTRTDVATVYDARSLVPVSEVLLPPKRAINPLPTGNAALSDDDRFLAIFNMTPATSLSIVDVESRSLVGEVSTPGCSLVYPVGARRFATLCADGGLLVIEIDDAGGVVGRIRSEPFFDPITDPVTEKAVRWRDRWIFVSFEGYAHPVDFSGPEPRFEPAWSLLDDGDREQGWRIGGAQHLALHAASGRLFSLVHQGGPDTHKDAGREVWVYDLSARKRVQRIALRNPGITWMGYPVALGSAWWDAFLLDHVLPTIGIDQIAVTQDDEPLLLTGAVYTGALCVYDAKTGELLRRVFTGNTSTQGFVVQPRRTRTARPVARP